MPCLHQKQRFDNLYKATTLLSYGQNVRKIKKKMLVIMKWDRCLYIFLKLTFVLTVPSLTQEDKEKMLVVKKCARCLNIFSFKLTFVLTLFLYLSYIWAEIFKSAWWLNGSLYPGFTLGDWWRQFDSRLLKLFKIYNHYSTSFNILLIFFIIWTNRILF